MNLVSKQFIVDFVQSVKDETAFVANVWPTLSNALEAEWTGGDETTLESIWVLLEIRQKFPKIVNKSFVQETFKRKKLLYETFCQTVCAALMVRCCS